MTTGTYGVSPGLHAKLLIETDVLVVEDMPISDFEVEGWSDVVHVGGGRHTQFSHALPGGERRRIAQQSCPGYEIEALRSSGYIAIYRNRFF
jgi:hypothetical protein